MKAALSVACALMISGCHRTLPAPGTEVPQHKVRKETTRGVGTETLNHVYAYRDGKAVKHGPFTRFGSDGEKRMEGNYREGKLHGKLTRWHANGNMQSEEEYDNGELHGTARWWEEDGKPFSEIIYVRGKAVSERSFKDGRWIDKPIPRDLCQFSAVFSGKTRVQATLYHVSSGSARRLCTHTMTRSPNAIPIGDGPQDSEVTLLMTDKPEEGMVQYWLESRGSSRSSTSHTLKSVMFVQRNHSKAMIAGDLMKAVPEKQSRLIYAEGDAPIQATSDTTPEEFAAKHAGNYLIVSITWKTP